MRIFFNRKPVSGPWGGGSKVLSSITEECLKRKHEISFDYNELSNQKFDVVFCMDPRPCQEGEVSALVKHKNSNQGCRFVQRVGDLGTHGKPELLPLAQSVAVNADVLVFPSNWALKKFGKYEEKSKVIVNAPLGRFYESKKQGSFDGKIRLLTHHWSDNPKKGFKMYQKLNEFCRKNERFIFTYIGRAPSDVQFDNHLPPLDVDGLLQEMPKHDLYVTASVEEAGANHVLEAMAIGLPILYQDDGGSINEYCRGRGVSYHSFGELKNLLEKKLDVLLKIPVEYSRTSEDMAKEYVDMLENSI